MDKVLRPHSAYAAAYLDDIIIHSNDWQRHMEYLCAVLRSLGSRRTRGSVQLGGWRYSHGHGHGQVRPQIDKTFKFTFMHLADAFIQIIRLYIFISTCVPWESNPQPFAQLTQCSTTEPHRNTRRLQLRPAQVPRPKRR